MRKNDRVIISWLAANHDEHEFERADEVILDRAPNRHLAFGLGPHRCIGSHLARLMSEVMVKAVLDRIPDYRGRPRRRPPIHGQPGHDRAGHAAGHLHPRRKSQNAAPVVTDPTPMARPTPRHLTGGQVGSTVGYMSIDDDPVTTLDDLKSDLAGRHKWTPSSGASVDPAIVDADMAALDRDGYVIWENLLSADECQQIRERRRPLARAYRTQRL